MHRIKIGVVEDELIIADRICSSLQKLGYDVTEPCVNYKRAVRMIEEEQPDLLLLDIQLAGQKDGIELAAWVRENHKIPFIFLTANSDTNTVSRAKEVKPYAYLVKPFTTEELFVSIEIALDNFNQAQQPMQAQTKTGSRDHIFIKDSGVFHKVPFNQIIYAESNENYVVLHLADARKLMLRSTFKDFLQELAPASFVQVHRSFAVNPEHIDRIEQMHVIMKGKAVPFSKGQREMLMKQLGIG
jgi:DNA-binding LytR/AlgR family response regulator